MDFIFHLLSLPFQAVGFVFQLVLTCFSFIFGLVTWLVSLPIMLLWGTFKGVFGVLLSVVLFVVSPLGIGTHSQAATSPQLAYQATSNPDYSFNKVANSSNSNVAHKTTRGETMERSNYDSVRQVLSTSQFLDDIVDEFGSASSTPIGKFAQIANKVVQGGIYAEDWLHTDKEIERIINDVLSSLKLGSAAESPALYSQFENYMKNSLKNWVPDRDYPKIGYLPKKLVYDQSLGEKEITKYWPEAGEEEQEKYVALTFDELILNYELVWDDLQRNSKSIPKY
jgi:hypothetical protein